MLFFIIRNNLQLGVVQSFRLGSKLQKCLLTHVSQALGDELRNGEKVLEEVKFIGSALKEEDTSVDYTTELDLLLDTFSILADSVSTKTVLV